MRFLVDECTGPAVALWLTSLGHEVFSVFDEAAGISDEEVLSKAFDEDMIVITETGARNMTEALPRTPEAIEKFMARGKSAR